ncbi:hypothetical protein SAMN04488021_14416 [Paracoccus aminovorans]|uniref:Uncharacterized protein n=1 Tax=Paracoccus aminovorans TaxID=34004 RepID=A0A1I3E1D1_9RHOB|nr:hypothetical protein [Paracoccus aminovorans]CQR84667.1 hypothetical protein JCM7685_0074 [Paracoccus aminovorans]SFH92787.1 hypothetical protein SAMN04488021_14416 [Paracoccus aminovorans]
MSNRRATDNTKALAAFVGRKAEIDAMLARLQALSADHFNLSPEEVNSGDVGTLEHYASLLRRITDSAFKEGEHAA